MIYDLKKWKGIYINDAVKKKKINKYIHYIIIFCELNLAFSIWSIQKVG